MSRLRIFRPLHDRFQVHGMPAPRDGEIPNKAWFKEVTGRPIRPKWVGGRGGHWVIAREHMTIVAQELAIRFGEVEVIADYSTSEKCDRRCKDATGDDCECSCRGANHGDGTQASWKQVGDTTLVRSSVERVRRTLTAKKARKQLGR